MRRLVLVVLLVAACKSGETDPCAKAKPKAGEGAFAWIEDDYSSALACAKAKKLPLVLDLWAPWCHTCLSMQTMVFTDPSFQADAPKFVFAALDTDREVNAKAVEKYPPSAWPTFYVIGPDEKVLARFVGAATVAQFHHFLDAGTRAMAGGTTGPDQSLLAGERAVAAKDFPAADAALTDALEIAPADWPRRADALTSLIRVKLKRNELEACVTLAEKSLDETGNSASATDFMAVGYDCAKDLLEKDKAQADRIKALRERMVKRWQELLADTKSPMSIDDRSDAMMYTRDALVALERKDEATAIAEGQRQMLDKAAADAPSPLAAMTYNWPRAEVYVFLGKPLDLVPALEKSAADLPNEYDPKSRLGWVYLRAGKLDEAAKWTDKAIAQVYGPRKARMLTQRAEIAQKQNDKATERAMREQLVKLYESLPQGQASPDALAKAKQALADLDKAAGK
jgi:thioredoxin-like negative regulator of GroEL